MRFLDDPVLANNTHINPAKSQAHSWAKLKSMWKDVKKDYNASIEKYTQSGTHDHNFFSFCNNKVETYYLRKCLELRPNLTATIRAELPEECALSSEGAGKDSAGGSNQTTITATPTTSTKKQKRETDGLSDVLREFQGGVMNSDLSKKKILILDDDHEEKKRRQKTEDWSNMAEKILGLRRELRDESLDNESKRDLKEYLGKITKLKNKLESELGLAMPED